MAKVGRLIKESMVQELTAELSQRPNFFVAGVGRLSAVEADTLRKRLHGVQARLLMVKRTLGRQGLLALKLNDVESLLQGSVVLVIPGEDLIPAAKLLADFAKADEEKLIVRGGFVEGQVLDKRRFTELANLPSRLQLFAELIGTLESPMTDVIMTIERVIGELAWVLEEAAKAKPAEGPAAAGGPPAQAAAAPPTEPHAPPTAAQPEPPPPPQQGSAPTTPATDTEPQQEG